MRYFYELIFKVCVIVLFFLLLFLPCGILAQGEITWKRHFGGQSADFFFAVTTSLDGIVAVGRSNTNSFGTGDWVGITGKGNDDAIIVKYDHNGGIVWKKNFGANGIDQFYAVTTVSNGFVTVGFSDATSFGNGDWAGVPGKGGFDAIIVKYDNSGNVVWKKNFGGTDMDLFSEVTSVFDGIVAVGYSGASSFGNGDWTGIAGKGNADAIIVKYDHDGNVVWKKNFGGSAGDAFRSVTKVSDGIVAAGYSDNYSFGNGDWTGMQGKGGDDATIVKYDHNGNVVWKKNFGGSNHDHFSAATSVSDGIVAVGWASPISFGNGDWMGIQGKGGEDAIIVKFDNNGGVVWKKNFGGSNDDYFSAATSVSDGIIAAGYSYYNSFGNGDWENVSGKGIEDAIIVKYNNIGNVVWKRSLGGTDTDQFLGITSTPNDVISVGYSGATSFGTGDWTGVTGKGSNDAIIVNYFNNDETNAQISNTQANFSCPGQVAVTYDLTTNQPVDVTLYYSHNQCDWLVAQTVSGDLFNQTTGTGKTIIWYNYTDNVRFGKFYFKVEAPQPPDCVMINGVCWAKRNVDMPGTFTKNPENAGMFYQWGSNVGWSSTDPLTASDGINTWRNLAETGNVWLPEKNPCPDGWRVPTEQECQSLVNSGSYYDNLNGINGHFFGSVEPRIFFPASGLRTLINGMLQNVGERGYCWSSTIHSSSIDPYGLFFFPYNVGVSTLTSRAWGINIRCVKE